MIKFFQSQQLGLELNGFRVAMNVTVANLIEWMGTNWLSETCLEAGIDFLQVH